MIFAANWKMQKSPSEAREFFRQLRAEEALLQNHRAVIFPPAYCWTIAADELKGSRIQWGGQNCYFKTSGAFTGENSPQVLRDLGGEYMLIGHSERRQLFAESDEMVALKIKTAQELGLKALVCIGETEKERERHETEPVLRRQIGALLSAHKGGDCLWVAYEPVWAIGTGKVATTEQVRQAHEFIRDNLKSAQIPLLYGGSVKPENIKDLAEVKNVDGFLIGGASLQVADYLACIEKACP